MSCTHMSTAWGDLELRPSHAPDEASVCQKGSAPESCRQRIAVQDPSCRILGLRGDHLRWHHGGLEEVRLGVALAGGDFIVETWSDTENPASWTKNPERCHSY